MAFTSTLDPRSRRKHERAVQCHPHCTDWCDVHLYEEDDCKRLARERLLQLKLRAQLAAAPSAPALLALLQPLLPPGVDLGGVAAAVQGGWKAVGGDVSPASGCSSPLTDEVAAPSLTSLSSLSLSSVGSSPPPTPPSPPPRSILTRSGGKRGRGVSAGAGDSARSHGTTYMSSDAFLQYFKGSRSLSEAVKGIVRDFPSYREVSIYARARRLECKFDSRGRFFQPGKKQKRDKREEEVEAEEEGNDGDSDCHPASDDSDGEGGGDSDSSLSSRSSSASSSASRRRPHRRPRPCPGPPPPIRSSAWTPTASPS